ncbi:MAG: phosphatase PAP2 family protein [Bdellovibrionales bacterium]|nr:phosphatase PAP2 family protein [Bdellovibrionales bacterium]
MKKAFMVLLLISLTSQSFGSTDYSYSSILKNLKACRTTLEGCTAQQEIEIASFTGNVLNSYDLENHLSKDTQKSVYIPLSLDNAELLTLAAATSLGVVAFRNDQDIMNVVQNHKSEVTKPIATVGNFLGTAQAGAAIAAGSYFMGVCFENNKLKRVGLFIVGSNLATSIVTLATKTAFGRARPNKDIGPYKFFNSGDKSFYSGHTAQAFSVATVISEMYKEEYPIVPYVAYGVAAITGYARMHDKAHWASDVIIGAVAGHLVTKLAMNYMNGNDDGRSGFEIYPGLDPNTGEFMIFLEWKGKQPVIPLRCTKMVEGFKKTEACLEEAFEKAKKHK